jgi:autotransporter-associated beta strand protein
LVDEQAAHDTFTSRFQFLPGWGDGRHSSPLKTVAFLMAERSTKWQTTGRSFLVRRLFLCYLLPMKSGINPSPRSVFLALVFFSRAMAQAQDSDGFWIKQGSGSWASAGNWDGNIIADGTDNTAYFGLSLFATIPSNAAFTLDGARTIGHLYLTAQSGPGNWSLNPGTGGPLTLDSTFDYPSVNVNYASQQVTVNVVLAGTGGLEKLGPGTLLLTATNTFAGITTVSGGTLWVNGWIGADGINVASGTLGGIGVIAGPVTVQSGSMLAPGNPLGTLTISNSLALQPGSTTFVEVNASTLGHDTVKGVSALSYGGTLMLSNLAGAPAPGQSFPIFNSTSASGNFSSLTPQLSGGLRWRFDPASGVLSVVSTNLQPKIASIVLSGGNLILQATNGVPGATNFVLASTNLSLPRTNWTRLATNVFDVSGNCSFANAVSPGLPQRFFVISSPAP